MLAEIIFPIPLKRSFYYIIPEEMELMAAPGLRVSAPLRNKESVGLITRILAEKDADLSGIGKLKKISKIIDEEPVFEEPVLELAGMMHRQWGGSLGLCAGEFYVNVPDSITSRNFPTEQRNDEQTIYESSFLNYAGTFFSDADLDKISTITSSYEDKDKKPFLAIMPTEKKHILAGILAKGNKNGQTLFLVPDQEYANYAYKELLPFFGTELGMWHSQMTTAAKKNTALSVAMGNTKLLIGTRTATFLPFAKLRLAVIDADKEECFRNEERAPLYNASDLLQWRMRSVGGTSVICAQCPSVEHYGRTTGRKQILINLVPQKDNSETNITISDAERNYVKGSVFSSDVREKISIYASENRKIVIITPRKGYASKIFCSSCGKMIRCPDCGPGLAAVRSDDGKTELLCRRCGKKYEMPEKCPACGHGRFSELGTGTQKAQSELQKLLPAARIIRYDGDILQGSATRRYNALQDFIYGDANIMVATKIALGTLKAGSIDLVVFLNAEEDLSGPDFRASAKLARAIFSAKTLIRPGGQIILQTREPDNFIFSAISKDSYMDFCKEELEARKLFRYPPYSRLILARFASKNEGAVKACGIRLKNVAMRFCKDNTAEIQGPVIPRGQENKTYASEYWVIKCYREQSYEILLGRILSTPQIEGVRYFIIPDPNDFP